MSELFDSLSYSASISDLFQYFRHYHTNFFKSNYRSSVKSLYLESIWCFWWIQGYSKVHVINSGAYSMDQIRSSLSYYHFSKNALTWGISPKILGKKWFLEILATVLELLRWKLNYHFFYPLHLLPQNERKPIFRGSLGGF